MAMVPLKPQVDFEEAKKIVFDLYGLKVLKVTELNGYYDKNFHVVVDKGVNNNANIDNVLKEGYVLKIVNNVESEDREGFEAQTQLIMFLNQNGIRSPKPIQTKNKQSLDILPLPSGNHIVRLYEFIPGDILFKMSNPNEEIFYQVGSLTGKINNALQNFTHAAYHKKVQWCLRETPDIFSCLHAINEQRRTLVKNIVAEFSSRVLTVEAELAKGVIHGDINEQNLIIETTSDNKTTVKAVIDFGDTHFCCYLYELALAMTYMIFLSNNVDAGGYVLAGYLAVREVTEDEFRLLKICVMARFCQSLVLGAHANLLDPDNQYVLTTAEKGWELLERLGNESEEAVLSRWKFVGQNSGKGNIFLDNCSSGILFGLKKKTPQKVNHFFY